MLLFHLFFGPNPVLVWTAPPTSRLCAGSALLRKEGLNTAKVRLLGPVRRRRPYLELQGCFASFRKTRSREKIAGRRFCNVLLLV